MVAVQVIQQDAKCTYILQLVLVLHLRMLEHKYRLQSKSADILAVNCHSNTFYVGVTLCLQSNSTDTLVANHSTEETICTSGWLASYRYLPNFDCED